jgi:FlaA1/EpsC-like NDP-sugar epimerase
VLGSVDSLPLIVKKYSITEVIVSVAREQQKLLRRVWVLCEELSVRIRVVPTLDEILNGRINISALKDVDTDELMGRERANIVFTEETAAHYRGKSILITGAGGSIGSELAYQLAKLQPRELILLDKDENGLHDACLRIQALDETLRIHPTVADLRFVDRLDSIFLRFRPETVFHAAAHKHVPLMEMNPCEAILNNVSGTRNVVEASLAYSVKRFVLVSTDKAVKPTSIMGASKRVCEMIVQARGNAKECQFCCVRFGNVLGSRGSVLPTFQMQVAHGEPLKITHQDVRRYLMTIPEAVSLLIQAGTLPTSQTFVLDMGEPVLIRELASRLIEYCGLRPGRDIPIEVACLRPGEKLSEELYDESSERILPTTIPRVNAIQSPAIEMADIARKVAALERAARDDSASEIKRILNELNIGFCGQETTGSATSEELEYATVGADRQARAARQS